MNPPVADKSCGLFFLWLCHAIGIKLVFPLKYTPTAYNPAKMQFWFIKIEQLTTFIFLI
jgi:hypothetical protein